VISAAEIQRKAGSGHIDPMIIERDYVLGCYLLLLAQNPVIQQSWIFKGGTCLRKCYFQNYRFSEDLDFTMKNAISTDELHDLLANINETVTDRVGIRFDQNNIIVEEIKDEYGKESFEAKVYYQGPWHFRGTAPALKIHLNRDEYVAFRPVMRPVFHNYSDRDDLPHDRLIVYTLEEALSEKLRAISGQRRFAIARDIYDIYHLMENGANKQKAIQVFEQKCNAKGISIKDISIDAMLKRRSEFVLNWRHNLEYLVPLEYQVGFAEAWKKAIELLKEAVESKDD